MGFLTDQAAARFQKASRRAYVPDWFTTIGTGAGLVAVVAFLAFALIVPSHRPSPAAQNTYVAPASTGPGATTSTAASTEAAVSPTATAPGPATDTATGTAATASGQVSLASGNGSTQVPTQALAVATANVTALFTGQFGTVPFAAGVQPPTVTRTWSHPVVTSPTVVAVIGSTITFSFTVDPDGHGPETSRAVSVTVQQAGSAWVASGA